MMQTMAPLPLDSSNMTSTQPPPSQQHLQQHQLQQQPQQQPQQPYEILGAVKIKDGLFIGDELAAQDLEFVVANKVTHIINCCGRNVPNHWESIGVIYLTYYWLDSEHQILLDSKDVVATECFNFLEEALKSAESVLIHSVRGQSRSSVVLAGYLMRKYSWGLRKALEFLASRRPDVTLKPAFLQQLTQYERRLQSGTGLGGQIKNMTSDWSEVPGVDDDELLLRNTYLNSHIENVGGGNTGGADSNNFSKNLRGLTWSDSGTEDKNRLERHPSGDRPHCQTAANGRKITRAILRVTGSGPGQQLLPKGIREQHQQQILEAQQFQQQQQQQAQQAAAQQAAAQQAAQAQAQAQAQQQAAAQAAQQQAQLQHQQQQAQLQQQQQLQQIQHQQHQQHQLQQLQQQQEQLAPQPQPPTQQVVHPPPVVVPTQQLQQQHQQQHQHQQPQQHHLQHVPAVPSSRVEQHQHPAPPLPNTRVEQQQQQQSYVQQQHQPTQQHAPLSLPPATPSAFINSFGMKVERDLVEQRREIFLPIRSVKHRPPVERRRDPSPKGGEYRRSESPVRAAAVMGDRRPSSSSTPSVKVHPHTHTHHPLVGPAAARGLAGMSAFRNSGPVKAHRVCATRPSTAPSTRPSGGHQHHHSGLGGLGGCSSSSRPPSPLLQRQNSSRPGSPVCHARNTTHHHHGASSPMPALAALRTKSLSSHMRRAPSPTPAFNRAPSPSKPRWRM